MNLLIRQYQDSIIEITNAFEIPVEAKRLVLRSILEQIEVQANLAISRESAEKESKDGESD